MPIYEYECNGCGHTFEKLVRMSQITGIECPECHGEDVRKLMSMFGFTGQGIKSKSAAPATGGGSCGSCSSHHCGSCSH